ncbi:VOC family protein [Novosphingobium sp. 2638]|uniref:VOC family protein n=2 Tax=Novosphingobium beihaiensis TaxID=2930389 RepID=A0ABT0BUD3_9SPHN|nr:VOC family protein [Novosphingobium beihaiensis]
MKAQIEFFTQAVGMKLVGLIPMHGVEGASHSFLQAGKDCYLSFVEVEGVQIAPEIGVSHPQDITSSVAGGAMQHVSFNVDTLQDMLDLRDRLRSHGYAVVGPLDHGLSQSMYLGAPEGILLEFATGDTSQGLTPAWMDKSVAEKLGISPEELARYIDPEAYAGSGGAVPQPKGDGMMFPTPIPPPMFEAVGYMDDAQLRQALNFAPDAHASAEAQG